ncbi:hypothetical protein JB92DRAFT_1333915 [Gautieria morchelliformis]|nr:hypothetical protein JB92DRAFT_1333915 [Gautieria morchelliformis]
MAQKAIAGSSSTSTMPFELETLLPIQRKKKKIGTWRYMSRDVFEARDLHTYLDDLESCYYVLCWILMVYTGPRTTRNKILNEAAYWDEPDSARLKRSHCILHFDVWVDPWFGPCLHELAKCLFDFFSLRRLGAGMYAPPVDPDKDYDTYLGHIDQCVLDMEAEDLAAEHPLSNLSDEPVQ